MDLFDYMRETNKEKESPLASRMRPVTLDEVVGQKHIIGKDKLLYRAIKADKLSSLIFYGPPGTGKTTLAKVIAHTTSAEFKQINATVAGKKDMEEVVKEAKDLQGMYGKKTILFIDEIHRFNKGQQDYLLPFVEDGTLILIGATTENPYFEVNGALISRSSIFELRPLEKTDIKELDNGYELEIDLPGFKKDEVTAELKDGYLTVSAAKGLDQDEQEKETGRYIRRERYAGACQRSYYVGEDITEEDIKAEFKHGILKLFVPKKEAKPAVEEKKYITIEG